jgi:hypothetical protein
MRKIEHAVLSMLVASSLVACSGLPKVSEEAVKSLEGQHVRIVSQRVIPNPTDEWMYTYVVLEVSGPGSHIDTLEDVLSKNGWRVREGEDHLLISYTPDVTLSVQRLESFLEGRAQNTEVARSFSALELNERYGYYVVVLMPL